MYLSEPDVQGPASLQPEIPRAEFGLYAGPLKGRRWEHNRAPLSFAQQRLWFLDRLEPDSLVYRSTTAVELSGKLDVSILRESVQRVVDRHESLRTVFQEHQGIPEQVVVKNGTFGFTIWDCTLNENELSRRVGELSTPPMDLSTGPLLRVGVMRSFPGSDTHWVLFTLHHLIADGWSYSVFMRELGATYHSLSSGVEPVLPPIELQYRDYAAWQREFLRGEKLEELLRYWRRQLKGLAALDLPTDFPRPAKSLHQGRSVELWFDRRLSVRLRQVARQHNVTLFMLLMAGFQVALARCSGSRDIILGCDIANRNRQETEEMIGLLVNQLPLRVSIDSSDTFGTLLARTRRCCLKAYTYQDLPFERLVEELVPERHVGRSPIFQVKLGMQRASSPDWHVPGIEVRPLTIATVSSQLDLNVNITDSGERLHVVAEYDPALFCGETVHIWLQGWRELLARTDTNSLVKDLMVASEPERRRLLSLNPKQSRLRCRDILQAISFQVHVNPDRIAVVEPTGNRISYAYIWARAELVAGQLAESGAVANIRIAILLERDADLITAMLAVWRLGAAYLPLDSRQPEPRRKWFLQDSGATLVVSTGSRPQWCPTDIQFIDIHAAGAPPPNEVESPENLLAYILYTSGSSGRPKPVAISRSALSNFAEALSEVPGPQREDIVLALTPPWFDISLLELICPLTVGSQVVIASRSTGDDGRELIALWQREQATWCQATPSTWRMIESAGGLDRGRLLSGGEVLSVELARKLSGGGKELWNLYGPTETTVWSTLQNCTKLDGEMAPPIGRPTKNTAAYVLNERAEMAAPCARGELYLGGKSVAAGYLGQPALTAERFVPDPFSRRAGARMYRTGDSARWRSDGVLEFLGRLDRQVKLRGHRIEPGEIESLLEAEAGVEQAIAVVQEYSPEDRRLVGFVKGSANLRGETLRMRLVEQLPEYMRPYAIMVIESMPFTPNGKVDRRALELRKIDLPQTRTKTEDATSTEAIVGAIWKDVLRSGPVHPDLHFFESGGHSLLATQVTSRVSTAFGIEMPVRTLFECPTVRGFSRELDRARRVRASCAVQHLIATEEGDLLPLSFQQEQMWLVDKEQPSAMYNMSGAVRLDGALDLRSLQSAWSSIVERHPALRTIFPEVNGHPCQQIAAAYPVELPIVDLSDVGENEAIRLAAVATARPFDLRCGPVWRTLVLRLGSNRHMLVSTIHHIASDGWSMTVLQRELFHLYNSFRAGHSPILPDLPIRYADYARWQRESCRGEMVRNQLAYWKAQLQELPSLDLPMDYDRPPVPSHRGSLFVCRIDQQTASDIYELCRREDVTLFMALLTAFYLVLVRYSGQCDLAVGTPVANRNRLQVEDVIGCFVNLQVLRVRFRPGETLVSLIRQVREICLTAYDNQDLPFEILVKEVAQKADRSRPPLFQIMFSVEKMNAPFSGMDDLRIQRLPDARAWSKFDLSVSILEEPGGLIANFEYATDLFVESSISRLAVSYQKALAALASKIGQLIGNVEIANEAKSWANLVETKSNKGEYPDTCIHELFSQQAEARPHAVALAFDDQLLTYGELNRRANSLSARLASLRLLIESRIGVYLDRSPEMIIAVLGILKAGCSYVPLDAGLPRDRLLHILQDAGASVLVTVRALRGRIGSGNVQELVIDEATSAETQQAVPIITCPENLAYVIYTSGSTGRPKGVQVTHGAVHNVIRFFQQQIKVRKSDSVACTTSLAFDISSLEILLPLIVGARLELAPNVSIHPLAHAACLSRFPFAVLQGTPSTWRLFLASGGSVERCRAVLCGGEDLDRELARNLLDRGARLWNVYGPTETTIWSLCARITRGQEHPPIGDPVSNTEVYILDNWLRPLPQGVRGELFIGGRGLARGYLNRPDLTAENFLPNPFGAPGSRIYKTGDHVRLGNDRTIEYLGRVDKQIKLRGCRIELGEIESSLSELPGVSQAVVTVREDSPGDQRLIAYIVPQQAAPSISDLRSAMQEKLPEYMVPSAFVILDRLPLTVNGKLDRSALPRVALRPAPLENRQPTALESRIAGIWEQVLQLDHVGLHDDFYDLGGDLLPALRVTARIRKCLGVELDQGAVFEKSTVAALADHVQQLLEQKRVVATPALVRRSRTSQS
jgi:amino acid adenylation domain-containing protein